MRAVCGRESFQRDRGHGISPDNNSARASVVGRVFPEARTSGGYTARSQPDVQGGYPNLLQRECEESVKTSGLQSLRLNAIATRASVSIACRIDVYCYSVNNTIAFDQSVSLANCRHRHLLDVGII